MTNCEATEEELIEDKVARAITAKEAEEKGYSKLITWLRSFHRFADIDKTMKIIKNNDRLLVLMYTNAHIYSLSASLPTNSAESSQDGGLGYLGMTASCRKSRVGENWTRGGDLPDGRYNQETFERIKNAIIAYELLVIPKD